jgi:hypothetical protein
VTLAEAVLGCLMLKEVIRGYKRLMSNNAYDIKIGKYIQFQCLKINLDTPVDPSLAK